MTNERISSSMTMCRRHYCRKLQVNSAVLSDESKTKLDELATSAMNTKGYVIEVSGYTDATGGIEKGEFSASIVPIQ